MAAAFAWSNEAICLRCEARLFSSTNTIPTRPRQSRLPRPQIPSLNSSTRLNSPPLLRSCRLVKSSRLIHTATKPRQSNPSTRPYHDIDAPTSAFLFGNTGQSSNTQKSSIRKRLFEWNKIHGQPGREFLEDMGLVDTTSSIVRQKSPDDLRGKGDDTADVEEGMVADPDSASDSSYEAGLLSMADRPQVGDLVELGTRQDRQTTLLAVVLRKVKMDQQENGIFLTIRGRWIITPMTNVMYRLQSGFAFEKDCNAIADLLPQRADPEILSQAQAFDLDVPRDLSGPLVSALNKFRASAEETYRLNSRNLDAAHDILAHQTDLRFGSLDKIAQKLLGRTEVSVIDIYLIRLALNRVPDGFSFDRRSHKATGLFQVRSKDTVSAVKLAREWIRDWRDQSVLIRNYNVRPQSLPDRAARENYLKVQSFIDKSSALIEKTRKVRQSPSGALGYSRTRYSPDTSKGSIRPEPMGSFDPNDITLIRYLESWSLTSGGQKSSESLPPVMIRATNKYQDMDIDQNGGLVFLQEIGVLEPWTNRYLYDSTLLLPMSQHSKPLEQLNSTLNNMKAKDADLTDSMGQLRHDWGNLTCFTIDSEGAQEIDDGISVERIPNKTDEWWIHVHVANPTSFIKPDSIFSRMAAHLTESFYSPERKFPMLPEWLSLEFFSLAKDRPCLTISSRINSNGQLLESKMRTATLRNVVAISYRQVADVLGREARVGKWRMRIGDSSSAPEPEFEKVAIPSLDREDLEDLRLLWDLAIKRNNHRLNNGAVTLPSRLPSTRIWYRTGTHGMPPTYPHRTTPTLWHGDPCLEMTAMPFQFARLGGSETFFSDDMVAEFMMLAGESGTKWFADRGVPGLFRCMSGDPNAPMTREQFMTDVFQPALDEYKMPSYRLVREALNFSGLARLETDFPRRHDLLGMPGYQRLTSPLRRYGDMILHYQIEAVLRQEAASGRQFDASRDSTALAFNKESIDVIAARLSHRERLIGRHKSSCTTVWNMSFLHRALHNNEYSLPERFRVVISKSASQDRLADGFIMDLGLHVRVVTWFDTDSDGVPWNVNLGIGDVLECTWTDLLPNTLFPSVRPMARVCREDGLNQLMREEPPGTVPW